MKREADGRDPRKAGGLSVERGNVGGRNAELVLRKAGGDLGVGAGVDVGVDAERNRRGAAETAGDLGEVGQLLGAFDVNLANSDY